MNLANLQTLWPTPARTGDLNLSSLLQRRLVRTVAEYLVLMVLLLVLWHLLVGAALTNIIVNSGKINREAEAYAVKADADVKRSIGLATQALETGQTVEQLPGLSMSFAPVLAAADPYGTPAPVSDPTSADAGLASLAKFKFPSVPVAPQKPSHKVVGVGGSGANFFAVISDGKTSRICRVGDFVADWQIIRISDIQVIVAKGQRAVALDWKGD